MSDKEKKDLKENEGGETPNEMSPTRQLVQYAMDKQYSKMTPVFKEMIGQKINTAVDVRKAEIGANMFNAPESDPTEG